MFKTYYKKLGFTKKDSYYSMSKAKKYLVLFTTNVMKQIPDPTKAKEYFKLLLKFKGKQVHKTSNNINHQKICCN